jgi:flagellar basal body-associated protein FliL
MMFLILVTLASLLIAVVMSVVAWRVAGEERRRSEARVAALAADSLGADLDLRSEAADAAPIPVIADGLFATMQPAPSGSRFAIVVAVGVIVVGSLATVGLLLSSGSRRATQSQTVATIENRPGAENRANLENAAKRTNPLPLELVALGHDRDGDRLTVRGIVRNPSSGAAVDRLTAVVFMFDREGGFLGSGRATVQSPALGPGGESTFVVTVPGAAAVGRYRVSFRTDDRVVPHVDRREHALARS